MMAPKWDVLPLDQATYWEKTKLGGPQLSILKPIIRRDFIENTGLVYDTECGNGQDAIYQGEALALGAQAIVLADAYYIYSARVGGFSKKTNKSSRTNMNFIGIANRIDALFERRKDRIAGLARKKMFECRDLFLASHRLNEYRVIRQHAPVRGWFNTLTDPKALSLAVRMKYRQWRVNRPPYTL